MVKVEALIDFDYKNYAKIQNLETKTKKQEGKIFKGDIFEVEDKEALYLSGKNEQNIVAVKTLEITQNIRPVEDKEKAKEIAKRAMKKIDKRKEEE